MTLLKWLKYLWDKMDSSDFRETLKDFAAGVTIVTTAGDSGEPLGATVSSFASLSLEPPLVLVCLKAESRTVSAIRARKAFAVHILDHTQTSLARRFASDLADKFEEASYRLNEAGVPCLVDCDDVLECSLQNEFMGGDHLIMVGRVDAARHADCFRPLVYAQRGFHQLGDAAAEAC